MGFETSIENSFGKYEYDKESVSTLRPIVFKDFCRLSMYMLYHMDLAIWTKRGHAIWTISYGPCHMVCYIYRTM